MPDITGFLSEFIKSDEVDSKEPVILIDGGTLEVGDYGPQLNFAVEYKKNQRRFTMNKTNANKMADIYGKDSDKWIGKLFYMTVARIMVGKELKDSIQIQLEAPTPKVEAPSTCEHKHTVEIPGSTSRRCVMCGILITK